MVRLAIPVLFFAAAVYVAFWLVDRRARPGGTTTPPTRPGPMGPDDDPAFLDGLDWDLRRRRRTQEPDEPRDNDQA